MNVRDILIHRGYWDEVEGDGSDTGGSTDYGDKTDVIEGSSVEDETSSEEGDSVEEESEETPETPEKPEGNFIPKSRFDTKARLLESERERTRSLTEELAALKQGGTTEESVDNFDDKLKELDDGIAQAYRDGDMEEVAKLNQESRSIQHQYYANQANQQGGHEANAAVEQMRLDNTIAELEQQFEALDPESEAYDDDIVNEVLDLKEAFEAKGMTPAKALLRATSYVMPTDGIVGDETPDTRKTDVKKNVEASNNLPPTGENTVDSDRAGLGEQPDAGKMTENDFDALPESTKAKMRGDFL